MARSKVHHFVAQSVLDRFKDRNGKLWHFSAKVAGAVEHRNTKTIFKIRNDNTFKADAESDDQLEQAYARHDEEWKKYTDQMITLVRKNIVPRFDACSKDALFERLHRQFWRSPDFVHDRDHRFINESIQEVEKRLGPMPTELANDDDFLKEIHHNTIVMARSSAIEPEILKFYQNFEVIFLKTGYRIEPFIIGSAIKCASNGLTVVPLSKQVAMALIPATRSGPKIINVTRKWTAFVADANISMAKQSRWGIAGPNKRQIEALARYCPTNIIPS